MSVSLNVVLFVALAGCSGSGQAAGPQAGQAGGLTAGNSYSREEPEMTSLEYMNQVMELINAPDEMERTRDVDQKTAKKPQGIEILLELTPADRQQLASLANKQGNVGPDLDKIFPVVAGGTKGDTNRDTLKHFIRNLFQLRNSSSNSSQPPCQSAECKERLRQLDNLQGGAAEVFKGLSLDPSRLKTSAQDLAKSLKYFMAQFIGEGRAPFTQLGEDCFQDVDPKVLSTRIKYQGRLYRNMMSIDKSSSDWDKRESKKLEVEASSGLITILENLHRSIMKNTEMVSILMENLAHLKRSGKRRVCDETCEAEKEEDVKVITSQDQPAFVEKSFILETKDKDSTPSSNSYQEKKEEVHQVKKAPLPAFQEKNFILETKDHEVTNTSFNSVSSFDIFDSNQTVHNESSVSTHKEDLPPKVSAVPEKREKSFILETKDKAAGVEVKTHTQMTSKDEAKDVRSGAHKVEKDLLLETRDKPPKGPVSSKDQSSSELLHQEYKTQAGHAGRGRDSQNFITETKDKRLDLKEKHRRRRRRKEGAHEPLGPLSEEEEEDRLLRRTGLHTTWSSAESAPVDRRVRTVKRNRRGRDRGFRDDSEGYRRNRHLEDSLGSLGSSWESRLGLDTDLLGLSDEFSLETRDLGKVKQPHQGSYGPGAAQDFAAETSQDVAETSQDAAAAGPPGGMEMPQFEEKIFFAMSEDENMPQSPEEKSGQGAGGKDGVLSQEGRNILSNSPHQKGLDYVNLDTGSDSQDSPSGGGGGSKSGNSKPLAAGGSILSGSKTAQLPEANKEGGAAGGQTTASPSVDDLEIELNDLELILNRGPPENAEKTTE